MFSATTTGPATEKMEPYSSSEASRRFLSLVEGAILRMLQASLTGYVGGGGGCSILLLELLLEVGESGSGGRSSSLGGGGGGASCDDELDPASAAAAMPDDGSTTPPLAIRSSREGRALSRMVLKPNIHFPLSAGQSVCGLELPAEVGCGLLQLRPERRTTA